MKIEKSKTKFWISIGGESGCGKSSLAYAILKDLKKQLVDDGVEIEGDFDWDELFGKIGSRWFHSGGIYAALSETTSELIIEAMRAAQKSGVITSFDLK